MKHWKPFQTGGLYTCMECDTNIRQQKEIDILKQELSDASLKVAALENLLKKQQGNLHE